MCLPLCVKAVVRAITKLPSIRERSVVRSSAMPSTKYSWSGSFDRFVNGKTTIDRRGARLIALAGVICGLAGVCVDTVGEFRFGQAHQAATAMQNTAMAAATRMTSPRGLLAGYIGVGATTSCVAARTAALIA